MDKSGKRPFFEWLKIGVRCLVGGFHEILISELGVYMVKVSSALNVTSETGSSTEGKNLRSEFDLTTFLQFKLQLQNGLKSLLRTVTILKFLTFEFRF